MSTQFYLIYLFLLCQPMIIQAQYAKEGLIDIIRSEDNKKIKKPKAGDVYVVRSTIPGLYGVEYPSYDISFYLQFDEGYQMSKSVIGDENEYSKCAYKWLNDTLLSIKLFNPDMEESIQFEVYGESNGSGGSGILMPDQ